MFIFLALLTLTQNQITILYDNSTLTITNPINATISNSTPTDTCHSIIASDLCLFHLNSESKAQNWPLNNLASYYSLDFSPGPTIDIT